MAQSEKVSCKVKYDAEINYPEEIVQNIRDQEMEDTNKKDMENLSRRSSLRSALEKEKSQRRKLSDEQYSKIPQR